MGTIYSNSKKLKGNTVFEDKFPIFQDGCHHESRNILSRRIAYLEAGD